MKSKEYKKLLLNIGDSVHALNTSSVALSLLPSDIKNAPSGLHISWKSEDISKSKIMARNYIERSAYIYAVEAFYEFIKEISENVFWTEKNINFKGDEKKSEKVYRFLKSIPDIPDEEIILCEFMCNWRNKIVHIKSNAKLSDKKLELLTSKQSEIMNNFCNFDVRQAIINYEHSKITLKDVSTFITILIRAAKKVNDFFYMKIQENKDIDQFTNSLYKIDEFQRIIKQQPSQKKRRQIKKWLDINFSLSDEIYEEIITQVFST